MLQQRDTLLLFTVGTDLWILSLCIWAGATQTQRPVWSRNEERWKGTSNIDHIHRSISIYASAICASGSSGPCRDHFLTLLSLFMFSSSPLLPPAFTIYSPHTEGLYQLGGPRCGPQSSIEGLEDTEVRPLKYIHEQLLIQPHLFSNATATFFFCRANVRRACCCSWCTGETSWTQQVGTPAPRLATWPRWPQCWRRWQGHISKLLQSMWWSSWCHVRPCALKPSPWCPSKCCGQDRESHPPHLPSLF